MKQTRKKRKRRLPSGVWQVLLVLGVFGALVASARLLPDPDAFLTSFYASILMTFVGFWFVVFWVWVLFGRRAHR